MRLLIVVSLFVASVAGAAEKAEDKIAAKCREARKLVAEVCGQADCKIKNDKQYDQALEFLKGAPQSGQTTNAKDIKKLLNAPPTKDTIADVLLKINGSNGCEVNTYFRLASAVVLYYPQVKDAKKIADTKSSLKSWLEKDMRTEFPTLLSLIVRTHVVSQATNANMVTISDIAKKELYQFVNEIDAQKKKFMGASSSAQEDPANKWDPKTWQTNLKDEFAVSKKLADRWIRWIVTNWK